MLVVEDDLLFRASLCELLGSIGVEARPVGDAQQAVRALRAHDFDAVITDLEMPRVHGLEMVRAARTGARELPVIVVTAYVNSPASKSAFALGAKAVLNKPLKYDTLLEALPPP